MTQFLKRISLPTYVACFFMFLYLPIIILTVYSFNQGEFPSAWLGFSLHWYYDLFQSVEIWRAVKTTLIVAGSSALLSVVLGVMLVWGARKIRYNIAVSFYGNILVPDIVLAVGLLSLFSFFYVPLGIVTLVAGHTLLGLGFAVPVLKSRLDELDQRLVEASLDLGASVWYTFWHVVIPFLYPSILVATILVVIVSFDDFLISFFCAGASAQTLSLYIFTMIRSGISPTVNALSTLMLVVSSLCIMVISFINYRLGRLHE